MPPARIAASKQSLHSMIEEAPRRPARRRNYAMCLAAPSPAALAAAGSSTTGEYLIQ